MSTSQAAVFIVSLALTMMIPLLAQAHIRTASRGEAARLMRQVELIHTTHRLEAEVAVPLAELIREGEERAVREYEDAQPKRLRPLTIEGRSARVQVSHTAARGPWSMERYSRGGVLRPGEHLARPLLAEVDAAGRRFFNAPRHTEFHPTCDDCEWETVSTLDSGVVRRIRTVSCQRHEIS